MVFTKEDKVATKFLRENKLMVLRISHKAMVAEWTEQSFEENQRDRFYRTNKKCHSTAVSVLRRQHPTR